MPSYDFLVDTLFGKYLRPAKNNTKSAASDFGIVNFVPVLVFHSHRNRSHSSLYGIVAHFC